MKQPRPTELQITCDVAKLLEWFGCEGWEHTHFPAGELRTKATANRLKSMGLRPGWPDFILIGPDGRHYYLEIKRHDGRLSEAQAALALKMEAKGIPHAIARSPEDAVKILTSWGAISGVKVAA